MGGLPPVGIDRRSEPERATKLRRSEFLPDHARALPTRRRSRRVSNVCPSPSLPLNSIPPGEGLEFQLALDRQRVVLDGHGETVVVEAWRHQRGVKGIAGFPDGDRQCLYTGLSATLRAAVAAAIKRRERAFEEAIHCAAHRIRHKRTGPPQIDSHRTVLLVIRYPELWTRACKKRVWDA